jgi:hypothetical protein
MTRRRMVAATGAAIGAPLALSACGTESEEDLRSEANDPELIGTVLEQHLAVTSILAALEGAEPVAVGAANALSDARKDSIPELEAILTEADAEIPEAVDTASAESAVEALKLQLEDSIEASLEVIGQISVPEHRQSIHRFVTEDAAALAAFRSVLGEEVAPDAFVFGPPSTTEESG